MEVHEEVLTVAQRFLTKVKRSGPDDIMALCPFHVKADGTEERHPSFAMSLSKGLFFCHACQAKGNLFTFLRDIGMTRDIIERQFRFLIDSAAKNLPQVANDPLRCAVWDLIPVEEAVLGLFEWCPQELINSGFTQETLWHFEVGYDNWHQRITYPLRDLKGTLVGISGRNAEGVHPKYKVYTDEYKRWDLPARGEMNKRALLWNAEKAYTNVYLSKPGETLVVVEGFKACMWLWQCGVKNVVALLGTYLSWEQQWVLERIGATVYIFLDNNSPGKTGAIKAAERLSTSLNVHMVEYPEHLEGDDDAQPDSCTAIEVVERVANAPTYMNWLLKFADQRVE